MLFTSYEFLAFIGILFLLYYVVPKKFQWILLLGASYLFYAMADWSYLVFILVTTVSAYFAACAMEKTYTDQKAYLLLHKSEMNKDERKAFKAVQKKKRWHCLLLILFLNLGILAVLKYTNFAIANLNGILTFTGSTRQLDYLNLLLPMGISFYTFQTLGYLIDVYRGKYPAERNLAKLALFVSFFPQLVQGPISRFDDLSVSLFEEHTLNWQNVSFGLERILWGYFKKLVIADRIVIGVNTIIHNPDQYRGTFVFVGMLFYAFELYCDFTGGIDITIGVAEVMGIRVTENFKRPFFSKCIKEYWNRWHITMGSWFTDYIFYPISVCGPMLKLGKWSRKHLGEQIGKRVSVYLSCIVVWFTTGIWHGASWNFIVWGLGNCVVILISQEFEPLYRLFYQKMEGKGIHLQGNFGWKVFQVTRTVLLMSCLRLFDCYRDVPLTFRMFGTMFTNWNWNNLSGASFLELGLNGWDYLVLILGLLLVFTVSMVQRSGSVRMKIADMPGIIRFGLWYGLFLIVLILGAYGVGFDASQFIYNQF
ncbi:MAG: MBOAT family protein [Lachnospiraceae bacterium]|nr:MBOAT family protein [Lachnospiraceae bacterium]